MGLTRLGGLVASSDLAKDTSSVAEFTSIQGTKRGGGLTALALVLAARGSTQPAGEQESVQRKARAEARHERGTVRILGYPGNPALVYVTTIPDPRSFSDEQPKAARLAIVNLETGQWRDVDLGEQVKLRFGPEHPDFFFERSLGAGEITVSRE